MIENARRQVAQVVNAGLVLLHWQIGERIRKDILEEGRAEYGKEIVAALSQQLAVEYGRGFACDALFRMVQFVERFPDSKDCRDSVATIGLESFRGADYH